MKKKILVLILALTIFTSISNIAFAEIDPAPIREETYSIVNILEY
ncbi:hypothetical protein DW1_0045 [Proteiniborus sp. DW1]|nr:hypothetical protein [Proteiniborus sp. DW1]SCG81666.1 hypothetical protein DW1_0045 [Proteiniborus sp. DW1]